MSTGPRTLVVAAALMTAVLGLSVPAVVPVQASYASDCGAPDRTLTGGGSASISVGGGETVLLTAGAYTGGVDSFPEGARLCVSSSASLAPAYLNNAAGALVIAPDGRLDLPSVAVSTGFSLENEGTTTASGFNINGDATITNALGATLTINGSFDPAAGALTNNGLMTITGSLDANSSVSLTNYRRLSIGGGADIDGRFTNSGVTTVGGGFDVNSSATFVNTCALQTSGDLENNTASSSNQGLIQVTGMFANNGTWLQGSLGVVASNTLDNDGTVSGFGRFRIAGDSRSQGTFSGDSAAAPIVVRDLTPPTPPQIFDLQSGTVSNVVPGVVDVSSIADYANLACTLPPIDRPSADLIVSKSGPATVNAGGTVTYDVTVTNEGPSPAVRTVVTDDLPAGLTAVTASDGGVVAGGTVTWDLGTLPAGTTLTRTITGTAPDNGTLVNVVSGRAATLDPDPSNNNGSDAGTVTTEVQPAEPTNEPPVANDSIVDTTTGAPVTGRVDVSDPDVGQSLRTRVTTTTEHGRLVRTPGGTFLYLPERDFTGVDSFDYQVCDNYDPPACDTATVTINVSPVAADDAARTPVDEPVTIPVQANDTDGAEITTVSAGPTDGTVAVNPDGTVTYTPDAGFSGTDTFTYTICSPTAPTLCDSAVVAVRVLPSNDPPTAPPLHLTTETGDPVPGQVAGTDPDDDDLTYSLDSPPTSGTVEVQPDGSLTYTPEAGFSGRDSFTVDVCDDGDPELCSNTRVTVDVNPRAVDDEDTTAEGTPVTIPVLDNDLGASGPPTVVEGPGSGEVRVEGDTFVYTPDAGFAGTDTFTYEICSPAPRPLCRTATVTVVVTADDDGGDNDGGDNGGDHGGGSGGGTDNGGSGGGTDGGTSSSDSGALPETGGPALWVGLGGLGLLLAGVTMVAATRRRRTPDESPHGDSEE